MPLTTRMQWTIPTEETDPWFTAFESLLNQMDLAAYAGREDRNLVLMGGGTISWTLSTSTLAWSEPIRVFSPITGFQCVLAAGSVVLADSGQLVYAPLVRYPTGSNKTITAAVAAVVPTATTPNDQLLFAIRYGDLIYWRNGITLADGDSIVDFQAASSFVASGDLDGNSSAQTVVGIQGRDVTDTAPTTGQVYKWNGAAWAPSADAGGTMPTMVFRPSGTPGGNVYADWSNLMSTFGTIEGPVWIELDDSVTTVTIPSGTHDMEGRAHFVSKNNTSRTYVQILPGCTLLNPASFRRLNVDAPIGSTGKISIGSGQGSSWFTQDCDFTTQSSANALIELSAPHAGWLVDTTFTSQGAAFPVVGFTITEGAENWYLEGFSSIPDDVFDGPAGLTIWLENSWTSCSDSHSALTGSIAIKYPLAVTGLVFQPGGTEAGNVYTAWDTLMDAFAATSGAVTITIDDSVTSPAVIPTGTWDMEGRATFVGDVGTSLVVGDGSATDVQNPYKIESLLVSNAANGKISVASVLYIVDSTFVAASDSLIEAADASVLYLHGLSSFASGQVVYELVGAGVETSEIYVGDFSSIATDTLKVAVGDTLTVYIENTVASCSDTQADVAGTLTIEEAPGGASSSTFVFQPGGTDVDNVYTDWTALMTAVSATYGTVWIELDDSVTTVIIPTGTHDMEGRVHLVSDNKGSRSIVQLASGCILRNPASFYHLSFDALAASTGKIQFSVLANFVAFDCSFTTHSSANELVQLAAPTTTYFRDTTVVSEGASFPVIECGGANGGSHTLYLEGFSSIPDNSLSGNYGATVWLENTWTSCSATQPAKSGSLTINAPPSPSSRVVLPLTKGALTNATVTPLSAGAAYLDSSEVPTTSIKLRVVLETTSGSAGYEAYFDLYDVNGVVSGGTPAVVTGSQIDTGSGSPPTGGPTPNPLVPSAYEVDITSAFSGWTNPGTFEARLWIGTAGGGNAATCKSAELIFE